MLTLVLCVLLLSACNMRPPPQKAKPAEPQQDSSSSSSTEPAELTAEQKYSPMGKAHRVEDQVMDAKEKNDQELEQGAQ